MQFASFMHQGPRHLLVWVSLWLMTWFGFAQAADEGSRAGVLSVSGGHGASHQALG